MMYVAIPMREQSRIVGTVRTSIPASSIDEVLGIVYRRIAIGGVLIALLAAAAGFALSRRFSRPLEEIKRGTERLAGGDLAYRLPSYDSEEAGSLAEAVNSMAAELQARMNTIVSQRNQQAAVFSSMTEGVLAVDTDRRIISINRAAADLLSIDVSESVGRTVEEAVRRSELQRFLDRVLESAQVLEEDIVVFADAERHVRVQGAPLTDAEGVNIGAVVVLNDQTRMRKLESVRRDFVANVSHELKTPITTVKGFVETLQAGAVGNPEEAERFLGIMEKQVDRLDAIIDDLLDLSRIEREAERGEISLEEGALRCLIDSAVQVCEPQAGRKGIDIRIDCDENLRARFNAALLEQAVVNLVDNAIKYSDSGTSVTIKAAKSGTEIAIEVCDEGCGIEAHHLPRLFERFYRVDKARSRKVGGTGLGLAIVKHVAQDHGGSVTVESRPGEGSTFTIHLPRS
jgi:two-component system phosphate regulon sensor histidine kinase PhoR